MVDCGEMWGINMFIGEYHHTIDEKGRITIPSKFRDGLGDVFVVTRGIENCLFVYSLNNWNEICDKLNLLPFTKKDARNFIRFFMSGATTVELDKQGRINILSPLISYAGLKKDCVIIEIASAPFGIDFDCATELGINAIKAGSLPGRISPETAGEIICDTVLSYYWSDSNGN